MLDLRLDRTREMPLANQETIYSVNPPIKMGYTVEHKVD